MMPESTVAMEEMSPYIVSQRQPILKFSDVKLYFDVSAPWLNRVIERQKQKLLKAVDGISFHVVKGETFSLVGESGCGKSTVGKLAVGLYSPISGTIDFMGNRVNALSRKSMSPLRGRLQMIFQDPYASLNPRWPVRDIIAEPIRAFNLLKGKDRIDKRVNQLLEDVGLAKADGEKYPHEFSGGQRQRVSIARALASNPDFIVCDEPTSSLDVSVQAQILNLMGELQQEHKLTYLFISHDLAVVYHISNDVGIMYLGRLVEVAAAKVLFTSPSHPYTRMLLDSIPDIEVSDKRRMAIPGEVGNPIDPPSGCSFHPRCPHANQRCESEVPLLKPLTGASHVACHGVEEGRIRR